MQRRNKGSVPEIKGHVWVILWMGTNSKGKAVVWVEEGRMPNLLICIAYASGGSITAPLYCSSSGSKTLRSLVQKESCLFHFSSSLIWGGFCRREILSWRRCVQAADRRLLSHSEGYPEWRYEAQYRISFHWFIEQWITCLERSRREWGRWFEFERSSYRWCSCSKELARRILPLIDHHLMLIPLFSMKLPKKWRHLSKSIKVYIFLCNTGIFRYAKRT